MCIDMNDVRYFFVHARKENIHTDKKTKKKEKYVGIHRVIVVGVKKPRKNAIQYDVTAVMCSPKDNFSRKVAVDKLKGRFEHDCRIVNVSSSDSPNLREILKELGLPYSKYDIDFSSYTGKIKKMIELLESSNNK